MKHTDRYDKKIKEMTGNIKAVQFIILCTEILSDKVRKGCGFSMIKAVQHYIPSMKLSLICFQCFSI